MIFLGIFAGQWSNTHPLLKYFTLQSVTELGGAVREEWCTSADMSYVVKKKHGKVASNTSDSSLTSLIDKNLSVILLHNEQLGLNARILYFHWWNWRTVSSFALSHLLNLLICVYDHKYRDHSAGQAFSRILWCRDSLGKIHPVVLVGKYNRNKN